jgi:hypothetical protein
MPNLIGLLAPRANAEENLVSHGSMQCLQRFQQLVDNYNRFETPAITY